MVYLLHYAHRLNNAQHYLGYSEGLRFDHEQRIRKHTNGTSGAHLAHAFYSPRHPLYRP